MTQRPSPPDPKPSGEPLAPGATLPFPDSYVPPDDSPADTLAPSLERLQRGDQIGSMRIMRALGQGGMGQVWLARDEALGRRVALKVLRPERLHNRALVLREARTTARFSHPHIVQIYAVGEHLGSPWLALELVEGGSFRERLHAGPMAVTEAVRLLRGVADALAHAHEAGVVHQDLKPENILVGRSGRARVADFGLAREVQPSSSDQDVRTLASLAVPVERPIRWCGTPPYMSPEQFRCEPPQPATDIWAFGILLHEVLLGTRPFDRPNERPTDIAQRVLAQEAAPDCSQLPAELSELVRSCLRPTPSDRPTAIQLRAQLDRLLTHAPSDPSSPPFRGLSSYTEAHAASFFGREEEVGLLAEQLRGQPFLPLVGPSGVGKSSLVLGGLLPRLREQGPVWLISLRPGRDPLEALSRALRNDPTPGSGPGGLPSGDPRVRTTASLSKDGLRVSVSAAALRSDPFLLGRLLRTRAAAQGHTAIVFVDQLEEVLTVSSPELRLAFLRNLALAADDPSEPVRVICTLRDDFMGRLALDTDVRRALSRVSVVQPPGPAALEAILRAPLRARKFRWEDDEMVAELIAETDGLVGSLPLLQVAGTLLWERRDVQHRRIPRAALREIGGLQGALATHADRVLQGLPPSDLTEIRRIMLRLVTPSETRAVVPIDRLAPAGQESSTVLERLVSHRLVVLRRAPTGGVPEAELVHEALITHWEQLRQWLDEGRGDHRLSTELEQAAELWGRQDRAPEACLSGPRLDAALQARDSRALPLSSLAGQFLQASESRSEARRRRQRWLVAGATLLVVMSVVSLAWGLWSREARVRTLVQLHESNRDHLQEVQRQRDHANVTVLQLAAMQDLTTRKASEALARALAGHALAGTGGDPSARVRSWAQVLRSTDATIPQRLFGGVEAEQLMAYAAPDPLGELLATAQLHAEELSLRDLSTGEVLATVPRCTGLVRGGAWSPDGQRLAHQCGSNFHVEITDRQGELLQTLPCGTGEMSEIRGMIHWSGDRLFVGAPGGVCEFVGTPLKQTRFFALDGELTRLDVNDHWVAAGLATAAAGEVGARVWRRKTGEPHLDIPGQGRILRQLLLEGDQILTREQGEPEGMAVWSLGETPERIWRMEGGSQGSSPWTGNATFSPDGQSLFAPWGDQVGRWDTQTWTRDPEFSVPLHGRSFPVVSPDGRTLVLTNWSGPVLVVDAETGVQLQEDSGFSTRVDPVVFLDDRRLLTLSFRSGPAIWDIAPPPGLRMPIAAAGDRLQFGGDRAWWLTPDGELRSRASRASETLRHGRHAADAQLLGSASTLAVTQSDGEWWGWTLATAGPQWRRPTSEPALGAAVAPDDTHVAIRTRGGSLVVLSRGGETVLERPFVTPGDILIDGNNYGTTPPTDTSLLWSSDSQLLLAQHKLSGETWLCHRKDWSCEALDQRFRQHALSFAADEAALYGMAGLSGDREFPALLRLSLTRGPAVWTWTDDRLRSVMRDADASGTRLATVTGEGQLILLQTDGTLLAIHELDAYSLDRVQFLPDQTRLVVSGWEAGQLWVWDAEDQRLLAHSGRAGWRYHQSTGPEGPQVWAVIEDRLLAEVPLGELESESAQLSRALEASNRRVCPTDLQPVVVVPFPDADTPWAPPSACRTTELAAAAR